MVKLKITEEKVFISTLLVLAQIQTQYKIMFNSDMS